MQAKYDARNPIALKQLVGAKVKLLPFPKPVLDASFKASMELYAELAANNPDWKKSMVIIALSRRTRFCGSALPSRVLTSTCRA